MMRHPFEKILLGTASILLFLLGAIAFGLWWQLHQIDKLLVIPEVAPQGIVSLELAFTPEQAKKIVEAWTNANTLDKAIKLQWLDFLFIFTYSTALSLACILSTKLIPSFDSRWLNVGILLAWGQWIAAGLDTAENLCLFPFLYGNVREGVALASIAGVSAVLKFGLIALGLIYLVVSIVIKVFRPS